MPLLDKQHKQLQSTLAMKKLALRFSLVAALVVFALIATPARAQQSQQSNDSSSDRLQRLERRLNELSERQQQTMRQGGVNQQQPGQPPQMGAQGHPMPPPNMAPPQDTKRHKAVKDFFGLVMFCCLIFNILIAIWIFGDIRKRGAGSGIFIVLALIAGIPTAIIYALVRIGDNKLIERTTITTP
jgi:hypothetical protein